MTTPILAELKELHSSFVQSLCELEIKAINQNDMNALRELQAYRRLITEVGNGN